MNKNKKLSKINGYKFLREAFSAEQNALKSRLELANNSITHDGELGAVNEQSFIDFLRQNLPERYAVNSAIVISSEGGSSDQIDVVIHDPFYSPTLLSQNKRAFVPIESVYAVFEVKPTINSRYLKYASEKAKSVRSLTPSTGEFKTIDGNKNAKALKIIAGLIAINVDWKDGLSSDAFKSNLCDDKNDEGYLDCGVSASGEYFDQFNGKLQIETSNSLSFFVFQLLHQLQLKGNAPGIDWNGYIKALKNES